MATRVLRRAEHLHRLLGALDRHLVEHDGRGLDSEVRRDDREQRREAVLVVDERVGERGLGGAAARPDDEVDVRDFVALADQRFADQQLGDQKPCAFPPQERDCCSRNFYRGDIQERSTRLGQVRNCPSYRIRIGDDQMLLVVAT